MATSTLKNGRTKMRWRDSGDVDELPKRASMRAAVGVPITAPTRSALVRRRGHKSASPPRAPSSTITSTGVQPTEKSPAEARR
jgi:hypothetical protein